MYVLSNVCFHLWLQWEPQKEIRKTAKLKLRQSHRIASHKKPLFAIFLFGISLDQVAGAPFYWHSHSILLYQKFPIRWKSALNVYGVCCLVCPIPWRISHSVFDVVPLMSCGMFAKRHENCVVCAIWSELYVCVWVCDEKWWISPITLRCLVFLRFFIFIFFFFFSLYHRVIRRLTYTQILFIFFSIPCQCQCECCLSLSFPSTCRLLWPFS